MADFTRQDVINAQTSAKIDILAQEMKDFKDEMRDFKNEMRERDNQRHAEILDIRNAVDEMGKHVRTLFYTSIAAIAALVFSVLSKS